MKSGAVCFQLHSAILLAIETAARRIWEVIPYISSFGNFAV